MTDPKNSSPKESGDSQPEAAHPIKQTEKTPETSGSTAVSQYRDINDLALDDPVEDQVDRSMVFSHGLKKLARWSLRLLIIAIAGFGLWWVLGTFWGGILPVIMALIVCTVLAPPTTWMRKHGVPSVLAALISILLFFGVLGGVIAIIAPDIIRQSQVLYLQVLEGVQRLQLWLQGPPLNVASDDITQVVNDAMTWLQNQAGDIAGGVVSGIGAATSTIINLFMVLVLTVFFLKDGHRFLGAVRDVAGRRAGWHLTEVLTRSWGTLGGYIRAQAIVSAIDAVCIGVGLKLIGVPMAFTLAVITFVAGFIPYVGAISAGALSVIVALVSLGFTEAILTLILIVAVQQLEGNILSPLLQSRAMNLHPVIVLVAVVIGGGMFGIMGAFLAVPVAAVIAVVLRYILDITALTSGEKIANDIEYVTPEGEAIGKLSEIEGKALRQKWRENESLIDGTDPAIMNDQTTAPRGESSREGEPKPTGRQRFEHLLGTVRRRR